MERLLNEQEVAGVLGVSVQLLRKCSPEPPRGPDPASAVPSPCPCGSKPWQPSAKTQTKIAITFVIFDLLLIV